MCICKTFSKRRIPSRGSRVVPLELWGPEGLVECKVKFAVAYPVVPLGKMIESGLMTASATCTRVANVFEIFRKGRIFVLRMRHRWLESKVQMEIDDDGEGAGGCTSKTTCG